MYWKKSFLAVVSFVAIAPVVWAQTDYANAGVAAKDGAWQIGVTFGPQVNTNTVANLANYSIAGVTFDSLRFVPQNGAIILGTTALQTNASYTLRVQNLQDTSGATLPALDLNVTANPVSWGVIGANELGFPSDAVTVGADGFDLVSGGIQFFDRYDESTFAYEKITGDFDKRVRVDSQWPSSVFAMAGLMVRETPDFGKARPSDPFSADQNFSRYLQIHVNPDAAVSGGAGNNKHQVFFRPLPPGVVSFDEPTLVCSSDTAPAYTNAWLRLKRTGTNFFTYYSNDGTNWVSITNCVNGTPAFFFPTEGPLGEALPPFPATVYVGLNYSPDNGNISPQSGERGAFLARFREYGNVSGSDPGPGIRLTIRKVLPEVEIAWEGGGTLQSRVAVESGSWENVPNAASPYRTTPQGTRFYRVQR